MRHTFRFPRAPVAVLLPLVLVVLAGCGTGAASDGVASLRSPGASDGASPSASTDPEEALLAFAQCMRDHGIDMPDPQIGGDGMISMGGVPAEGGQEIADMDAFREADEACRHHLAGVALGGPAGSPDPKLQEALLAFARCMREHGIDFPDPQFENGGAAIVVGGETGIDPSSPDFQAAEEACREHLPGGGPGAGVGPAAPAPGTEP